MAKFSAQISWIMRTIVEVEAINETDAIQKIYSNPLPEGEVGKHSLDIEEIEEISDVIK
jgi:ribosomal protein L20A (L18A)